MVTRTKSSKKQNQGPKQPNPPKKTISSKARRAKPPVKAAPQKAVPQKAKRTPKAGKKPSEGQHRFFPIVGIGASAGGLEATTSLLRALPAESGMAFVLVPHLDPKHESAMATLLSHSTSMPVFEAKNNLPVKRDEVYIIPPNKNLELRGRKLRLLPRSADDTLPIDRFFSSLAEQEGNRAIGIVLSGSGGSDGTRGLLDIKSAGGITFAQDEKSAKYPAMPAAAIASGCVDFIGSPEKIAHELTSLTGHPYIYAPTKDAEEQPAAEKAFDDVITTLRRQTSVDFSQYKPATLRRRMQRRMVLQKCDSLAEYARYVREHPAEARELFSDVLIHVTSFFRDAPVFQLLKRRLFPKLVKGRSAEEPIRIWVPGCSSGEEVYSLAIALHEFLVEKKLRYSVHIFGTDINENALEKARAGVYPGTIESDVSAERLRRFFVKTERGFRVNKTIREMCIFARQNVVTDPPFSNLDVVSCRNVLIYLGAPLQRKVIPLFHYALKANGHLLLGSSETIGGFAEMFSMVENKAKLYAKKATRARTIVHFEQPPLDSRDIAPIAPTKSPEIAPLLTEVQRHADRIVLHQHSPAGVVVNKQLEVLQFRGRTGPFLEHAHGEATLNLLKMAREGLIVGLRVAVQRAIKQNIRVREEGIPVRQNGSEQKVNLEIVPFQVPPSRERFYLVLFEQAPPPSEKEAARRRSKRGGRPIDSAEIDQLRDELSSTRESLQAIIEEQEATNEELRSANEEIMSSNEELQSTNEELATAKEELQSTNEELVTLNDELESRNNELENVNNDLFNLLASVNIPIVMVGSDLRIRRFTDAAEKLLNLLETDVGRPLTDINFKIGIPQLGRQIHEVIDTLQTKEIETQDVDGKWWMLRIRPYRTTDQRIDGAVLAVVDIDLLKKTMLEASLRSEFAEAIVNTVREPLVVLDGALTVQAVNESFLNTFRVTSEDTLQHRIYDLGNGQWNIPRLRTLLEEILPQGTTFNDFDVDHVFPHVGRKTMRLNARRITAEDDRTRLILLAIEETNTGEGA